MERNQSPDRMPEQSPNKSQIFFYLDSLNTFPFVNFTFEISLLLLLSVARNLTMEEHMRKLALWHTRTFAPLTTHQELEPIMLAMGFEGQPPCSGWKEYVYVAIHVAVETPPLRPRLPYPRIDGCHLYTFKAFVDAIGFYLRGFDVADVFHIRGLPLHRVHDRSRKWCRMQEEETVYVYREGTIDEATQNCYQLDNPSSDGCDSASIRGRAGNNPVNLAVPLKDIITG